jgi:hypothetical protein
MRVEPFSLSLKPIAVASTVMVGEIVLGSEADWIYVGVKPTGQALDAFVLSVKAHEDGSYTDLRSAAWGTATASMPITTGDVAATAAAGTHQFLQQVNCIYAVKFSASSAVAADSVTINGYISYPN